jgi:hypothetical protein
MSFPHRSNTKAYKDAVPPTKKDHHPLTTYSDACWRSQIRNAVRVGVLLSLFKFCSMSGAMLFYSGCPLIWKADRQDPTALSSCKVEIQATNMSSHLTINTSNMISDLLSCGYPIDDTDAAINGAIA